jgi:hypothetical protein
MSIQQKDYIQRLIEQLADALASLLKKRRAKQNAEARVMVGDACRELLGMEFDVLVSVDPRSAAELLGHPARVRALAQLVQQDAFALEGLGDSIAADARMALASQLEGEAQRLERK